MTHKYLVTTHSDDFPDNQGNHQASFMTQEVVSTTPLTDEDAWEEACAEGEWKIHYGEGNEKKVGEYSVKQIS